MADKTTQVMLHFAETGARFKRAVDKLFLMDPELTTLDAINIISPLYGAGYDAAEEDLERF